MKPFKSSFLVLAALATALFASGVADAQDLPDRKALREAARAIAEVYERLYVFPDMGKKMADLVRGKADAGQYDALEGGRELGQQITTDLQALCRDRHVVAAYTPERIRRRKNTDPRVLAAEELESSRRDNFGFRELRIMSGNVGYLKISSFEGGPEALEVAAAAMRFLAYCDAIIMDLRFNPGGDSTMVQFLASYFLGDEPVLLDEFHRRREARIVQIWSLPFVPGRKPTQADLYILTDGYTFSAAEGLAYDLQALKKAVVAGTPTAGGAHAVEIHTVLDSFTLFIPVSFSKNPVTGTNFQGGASSPTSRFPVRRPFDKSNFTRSRNRSKRPPLRSGRLNWNAFAGKFETAWAPRPIFEANDLARGGAGPRQGRLSYFIRRPIRLLSRAHKSMIGCPTISLTSTNPNSGFRLSMLSSRLSPITNNLPGGTFMGSMMGVPCDRSIPEGFSPAKTA